MEGMVAGRFLALFPVGQGFHAVRHTYGDRFATLRADAIVLQGDAGRPVDAASAMAIVVIFAFFGEELDGAQKLFGMAGFEGVKKGRVG